MGWLEGDNDGIEVGGKFFPVKVGDEESFDEGSLVSWLEGDNVGIEVGGEVWPVKVGDEESFDEGSLVS